MRDSAQISVSDASIVIRFVWVGFDGDDCFSDFHIDVTDKSGTKQFSFGPSAVHGLRKVSRFLNDHTQEPVSLGFRYPDIRSCDVSRIDGGYRLGVRFEGSGLTEQYCVQNPSIRFEDEFLADY